MKLTPPAGVALTPAAAFTPDSQGVIAVGRETKGGRVALYHWELKTGKCEEVSALANVRGHGSLRVLRWTPDGKRVGVIRGSDEDESFWLDARTWKPVCCLDYRGVTDLTGAKPVSRSPKGDPFEAFPRPTASPGGDRLVGLPAGKKRSKPDLVAWDHTADKLTRLELGDGCGGLSRWEPPRLSADGNRLAFGAFATNRPTLRALVLDAGTGEPLAVVGYDLPTVTLSSPTHVTVLSRTGKYLLTYIDQYATLRAWRVADGKQRAVKALTPYSRTHAAGPIDCTSYAEPTPKTDRFVVCSQLLDEPKGKVLLAVVDPEAETVTRFAVLDNDDADGLAVSPDETHVLCPSKDAIRVFKMPAESK